MIADPQAEAMAKARAVVERLQLAYQRVLTRGGATKEDRVLVCADLEAVCSARRNMLRETPHATIYEMGIRGNDMYGTPTTAKISGLTSAMGTIKGNVGYVTENGNTGTIANGTTAIVIAHGLDYTPAQKEIAITFLGNPTNDPGHIWVDTITATQMTVHCRNDPGADLQFGWNVTRL